MSNYPTTSSDLSILLEDDHILVVDKPAELLSVPGRGPDNQDSIASRAAARYPEIHVVHRLDCSTSGVMVLAKTRAAQSELNRQFRDRETAKEYIATGFGECSSDSGEIDFPLITDWPNRPRQMICYEHGKPSLTHYEVLARDNGKVRLRLIPVTGRSHQLRVHCMAIGLPLLGDNLYAPPDVLAMSPRLLLHAHRLVFKHPDTGHGIEVVSAVPF